MCYQVEVAQPRDFLSIAALDRLAWGEASFIVDGEHVWRVWCEHATVLVVRRTVEGVAGNESNEGDAGHDVVAALVMFPTRDGALFLHKIMVHPAGRGRGLGTALMKAALERATNEVLLTVDPANEAAVQMYRKYGFAVREHVSGYYRPNEDRYLMVYEPAGN